MTKREAIEDIMNRRNQNEYAYDFIGVRVRKMNL